MRLKIISDGLPRNTKVVNADTGEAVEFVTSVDIKIRASDSVATAVIEVVKPEVEVTAEAEVKIV